MHKQLMEDIEESILQISMELLHVSNDWFTQLSYEKWAFDDFFSLIHNVLLYLLPEQHIVFKQAVQPAGVFQPRPEMSIVNAKKYKNFFKASKDTH